MYYGKQTGDKCIAPLIIFQPKIMKMTITAKNKPILLSVNSLLLPLFLIIFFSLVPLSQNHVHGCTVILIGKKATEDGSVILAANDDWPGYPSHLVHVPRQHHSPSEKFRLVQGKKIPQIKETFSYNYVSCVYNTGVRDESWLYGINENQVAVAMAGTYNFKQLDTTGCHMESDDLPWLVLERASTAREAIEIITSLISKYGYGPGSVDIGGSVNLAIADPNEGWWFTPIPGNIWVATRVPDNTASFRPNCIGTHIIDLNDKENVLFSDNLVSYAVGQGWYRPGTPFDFAKVYCLPRNKSEGYHENDPVNALRRWRMACLFSGQDLPEDKIIYEVVPQSKISLKDVMSFLRDYLQGTKYDLSQEPAAGPYHNPFHIDWRNTLSRSGTVVSIVIQLRDWLPDILGGVMWVAFDTPATSAYIPWYLGTLNTPYSYTIGKAVIYDNNSAWWNFQEVSNLCYRMFDRAALVDVIPLWKDFENKEFAEIISIEENALNIYKIKGKQAACEFLNAYSHQKAKKALKIATNLKNLLRGKYLDNTVVETD